MAAKKKTVETTEIVKHTPGKDRMLDTPEGKAKAEKFLLYARKGNYIEDCCKIAGISRTTFYRWVDASHKGDPQYKEFMTRLDQAQAESIADRLERIEQAGIAGDWKADAWFLERVYKEKFAADNKVVVEARVNQEVEAFIQKAQAVLSEQDYARLMSYLADEDKEDLVGSEITKSTNVQNAEIVEDNTDDKSNQEVQEVQEE